MLPIRHRSIFKSRWIALLWAAGILWSAIEFVGSPPQPAAAAGNGTEANGADQQAADTMAALRALDGAR